MDTTLWVVAGLVVVVGIVLEVLAHRNHVSIKDELRAIESRLTIHLSGTPAMRERAALPDAGNNFAGNTIDNTGARGISITSVPLTFKDQSPEGGAFGGSLASMWVRAVNLGQYLDAPGVKFGFYRNTLEGFSGLPLTAFGIATDPLQNADSVLAEIERVMAACVAITQGKAADFLNDPNPKVAQIAKDYLSRASA